MKFAKMWYNLMMNTFALTLTDAGAWVALLTGAAGAVGSLIISIINALRQTKTTKAVEAVTEKVDNAAVAAQTAVLRAEEVKDVQVRSTLARDEKLEQIHDDIKENTQVSTKAFKEANDVNRKLETLAKSTLAAAEAAKDGKVGMGKLAIRKSDEL